MKIVEDEVWAPLSGFELDPGRIGTVSLSKGRIRLLYDDPTILWAAGLAEDEGRAIVEIIPRVGMVGDPVLLCIEFGEGRRVRRQNYPVTMSACEFWDLLSSRLIRGDGRARRESGLQLDDRVERRKRRSDAQRGSTTV